MFASAAGAMQLQARRRLTGWNYLRNRQITATSVLRPTSRRLMRYWWTNPPERIILDLEATDDVLHGQQEGRFIYGYYGHYCSLPLYIICGEHVLVARLSQSDINASAGTIKELEGSFACDGPRWRSGFVPPAGFAASRMV